MAPRYTLPGCADRSPPSRHLFSEFIQLKETTVAPEWPLPFASCCADGAPGGSQGQPTVCQACSDWVRRDCNLSCDGKSHVSARLSTGHLDGWPVWFLGVPLRSPDPRTGLPAASKCSWHGDVSTCLKHCSDPRNPCSATQWLPGPEQCTSVYCPSCSPAPGQGSVSIK